MMETGRVCIKIAGRDAGKECIVVDIIDDNYVLIDGLTRRRKCNIKHLEPLETKLKIRKNASETEIRDIFKKELKITIVPKKKKVKKEKTEDKETKEEPAKKPEKEKKKKTGKKSKTKKKKSKTSKNKKSSK
jgi:large subunit ribosomal protein L14e